MRNRILGALVATLMPAVAFAQSCGEPENTGVGAGIIPFDMNGLAVTAASPTASKAITLPDGRVITVSTQYISGAGFGNFGMSNVRPVGKFMPQFNGIIGLRTDNGSIATSEIRVTFSPALDVIVGDAETPSQAESASWTTNGGVWEQIDGTSPDDDYTVTGLETSTMTLVGTDTRTDNDFKLIVTRNVSQIDFSATQNPTGGRTGFFVAFPGSDGGDADGSYGNAYHALSQYTSCDTYGTNSPFLGANFGDADNPLSSAAADADDNAGIADEDGIASFPAISTDNTSYTIPGSSITASGSGTLHVWADFDGSGTFDTDEFASAPVTSGSVNDVVFPAGGLSDSVAGQTTARFRVTTDTLSAAEARDVFATDGEIEDHVFTIVAVSGDAPVATDDPIISATIEPVTISPLGNDSDSDGTLDPATVVLTGVGAPAGSTLAADGKTLTVPGEGEWTVAANGDITFTPEAGFTGDPTDAPYTVNDNDGNTSNPAIVSIDYGERPVAGDNPIISATIEPVTISPLGNDSDSDGTLDPATVVLTGVGAPAGSTLAADGKTLTVPGEGEWTVAANGDITFTPEAGFTGDPTDAPYTVNDNDGNTSNAAIVSIDYGDAPVAGDDTAANPNLGTPTTVSPLGNDSDSDGTLDPATVVLTGVGAPAGSILAADGKTLTVPGEGEWTVAANGDITFTPEAGFTGDPTDAPYTVNDNDGNTSNAAIVSIDYGDAPVAGDDTAANPNLGTPTTVSPLGNDSDSDGTLDPATVVLTGVGAPAGSTLAADGKTLTVPGEGEWTVAANGDITFTPEAGFTGDPTDAPYTVNDNDGNTSNAATVMVTYGNGPVAGDDAITRAVIEPVTINPLANDSDADGTLDPATVVLTGVGAPAGSTLSGDGKTLTVPGEGEWTVAANGEVTFTPEAGFAGDPTPAPYTVDDNDGNTSNPATITVDYGDAPVATDDVASSDVIESVTINPLANDTDADGTLDPATVVLTGANSPAGSTLAADGKTLTVPGEGEWTVAANGAITFTPEAGFTGNPTPVGYTVEDNDGNTSNEATVSVTYGEPPVATNDTVTPTEPGPVSIDPLANDNGDDPLDPTSVVLTGTGAPTGSTLSADGKTLTVPGEGEWTVNLTTGLVTFTPAAGFSGSPTPAAYTVSDVMGRASNEAVLSVTVLAPVEITATNDGPIALDGSNGDTSDVSVLSNDTLDGSPITDPSLITLTTVSAPTGVTLNPDGTVTVAPGTTPGTYTVVYEICETANPTNCATAEVEVVVVDTGEGLINEIEDDLVSILEEDLANTLQQQSVQIGGYSADALDRLRDRGQGQGGDQCMDAVNLHAKNILFNVDSAVILPDYFKPVRYETLDRIATILIGCPGIAFEIAGHTDSDASDAYNINLSQRRVNAVLQALAARGVDTSGYIARGYGESQPIASNATEAGKAQNRRVEFRPLDGLDAYQGPCDDSFSLVRNLNLNADENGVNADGQFVRDQHDCITDRREVFEGTLSYLDTQTGQTQSAINLSYRREQYRGGDSVFGYFAGLYGSKSEVTRLANGEINGFGVNAGIYGANRLQNTLFVDYYLGGALGRHSFDLAFDRDIGTIDASGDYQYFAGFTGAALSGEVALGDTTFTPRIGFDYVYTPGADVDVVAELSGLSQAGNLELDAISGGRVFAEVRFDHLVDDGSANIWFNPRVACYQSLGALDGACGVGGSIGIESVEQNNGFTYGAELDGEWGENYTQGALSLRASRDLNVGTLSGDAGVTRNGNATLGGTYEIEF